jgi:hypothetical protein
MVSHRENGAQWIWKQQKQIKVTVMENLEVNCILGMLAAIQFSIFEFHLLHKTIKLK